MEGQSFNEGMFGTVSKVRKLREDCQKYNVPEHIQDGYEEIIDKLLCCLKVPVKLREFFWTLTDPE